MKKRVLILGGTGFFGSFLCRQMLQKNYEIVMFNRGFHITDNNNVTLIKGDRRKESDISQLKEEYFDSIVDTMGWYPQSLSSIFELFSCNISSYIFISSMAVYGHGKYVAFQETDNVSNHTIPELAEINHQKISCEVLCKKEYDKGFPITVLRPSYIFANFNAFTRERALLDHLWRNRKINIPRNVPTCFQFISAITLCNVCIDIIENPSRYLTSFVYNVSERQIWKIEDWIDLIADEVNVTPRINYVDYFPGTRNDFIYFPDNIVIDSSKIQNIYYDSLQTIDRKYIHFTLQQNKYR